MKPWELSKYLASIGRKGGTARATNLTAKRRKEIAAMGGKASAKAKVKREEQKGGSK